MKVTYFKTPLELRKWFKANHATAPELWVGYYRKGSGTPSLTWPESVDEALSVGWIDGIRKGIDDTRYMIRFTPRRKGSVWSAVNIKRAGELIAERRMRAEGLKAFKARKENRSGIYSYEQRPVSLVDPYEKQLRQNKAAWTFFQAQPPWYRKQISWWVLSAKKEETRLKRLSKLIEDAAAGRRS